jgi:hypothetical protein
MCEGTIQNGELTDVLHTQVQAWMQSLSPSGLLVCSEHAKNAVAMNCLRAAEGYLQQLQDFGQVTSVEMIYGAVIDYCPYACWTLECSASGVRGQKISLPTLVHGLAMKVHEFNVEEGCAVKTGRVLVEFKLPPGQKSALHKTPGIYNIVVQILYV